MAPKKMREFLVEWCNIDAMNRKKKFLQVKKNNNNSSHHDNVVDRKKNNVIIHIGFQYLGFIYIQFHYHHHQAQTKTLLLLNVIYNYQIFFVCVNFSHMETSFFSTTKKNPQQP